MTVPGAGLLRSLSRELAFVCDRDGVVRWADERASGLLGLRAGESLEARAMPGTADKVRRFLGAVAAPVGEWELMLSHGDGHAMVACRGTPFEGGVLVVGTLVPHDYDALMTQMTGAVSALGALQRETERQQRELQRLGQELRESGHGVRALHAELDERLLALRDDAEARARTLATITHELRTPINSILGFARLLLAGTSGPVTAEQERQLGNIARAAGTLSQLVDELLDLARIDTGRAAVRPVEVDVREMFTALRGMFRPLITTPDVSLIFDVERGLPALWTDRDKLQQVLRNLVSNALKFTERGEVRVAAVRAGENRIAFLASDTGIGIAPEDQQRVFREFEQVESPLQQRVRGSGLGLALSRRLAALLGGTLSLHSVPGVGSTFTLTLPIVHPERAGDASPGARVNRVRRHDGDPR